MKSNRHCIPREERSRMPRIWHWWHLSKSPTHDHKNSKWIHHRGNWWTARLNGSILFCSGVKCFCELVVLPLRVDDRRALLREPTLILSECLTKHLNKIQRQQQQHHHQLSPRRSDFQQKTAHSPFQAMVSKVLHCGVSALCNAAFTSRTSENTIQHHHETNESGSKAPIAKGCF